MPPRNRRTPKDEFVTHGLRLLEDAENSKDPVLVALRMKYVEKFFDAHLKANAAVSPRAAFCTTALVLLLLTGITLYSAMEQSQAVFVSVAITCVAFALVFVLAALALCGKMGDTVVGRVILGMFKRVWPSLFARPGARDGEERTQDTDIVA